MTIETVQVTRIKRQLFRSVSQKGFEIQVNVKSKSPNIEEEIQSSICSDEEVATEQQLPQGGSIDLHIMQCAICQMKKNVLDEDKTLGSKNERAVMSIQELCNTDGLPATTGGDTHSDVNVKSETHCNHQAHQHGLQNDRLANDNSTAVHSGTDSSLPIRPALPNASPHETPTAKIFVTNKFTPVNGHQAPQRKRKRRSRSADIDEEEFKHYPFDDEESLDRAKEGVKKARKGKKAERKDDGMGEWWPVLFGGK